MLTIDVAELDAGIPSLLLCHLALPELHDDVHRAHTIADVIGEVRADTEAGTDTPLAIVGDLDSALRIETIREDDVLDGGVYAQLSVASDDFLRELEGSPLSWRRLVKSMACFLLKLRIKTSVV